MKVIALVSIVLFASVAFAQAPETTPVAPVVCPPAFGLEFPDNVREASIAFEKVCLGSQQKLADLKLATDKAREKLFLALADNSSAVQLVIADTNYHVARSEEMLAFSNLQMRAQPVALSFFDSEIARIKQGEKEDKGLIAKYGAWQDAALLVSRIPTRDDKELVAKFRQESKRRLAMEREEFNKYLKFTTPIPREK